MSKKQILFSITNGFWLIQPEYAYASAGIVQRVLNGEFAFESATKSDAEENAEKLSVGCFSISPDNKVVFGNRYNPFMNAEPGSIAVIGISGPIMKYDNCGDLGTKSYSSLLTKADQNPNISGVLLVIDSPGGTVDGTQELASEIKNFRKPIIALVDGLMASAAYWIGSSSDEIIANNNTAMIGSIGTMISFADMQPMYEKQGVRFHLIYADASKDKNKDFDEARKGNYDLIKEKLNHINNEFVNAVKTNRPGVKETALSGKTFMASDAVDQKLIDSIGDFNYAVSRLQLRIEGSTGPEDSTNNPKNNMKKITLLASQALLLAICGATVEAGKPSVEVDATDELLAKIEENLVAGQKASSELVSANTKISTLESAATTSATKITSLETEIASVKSELETLKNSNPGASGSQALGKENTGEEDPNAEFLTDVDREKADLKKRGLI